MARHNLTDNTPTLIQDNTGADYLAPQVVGSSDVLFLRTTTNTAPTDWSGAYRVPCPRVGQNNEPFPISGLTGYYLWAIPVSGPSTIVDGDA